MRVTDHALVRYIDRRLGIGVDKLAETLGIVRDPDVLAYFARNCRVDVERWRDELREEADRAALLEPGNRGHRWLDGLGFVIKEDVLVTVIPADKPKRPRKLRRLPKLRQPGSTARLLAKHGRVARRRALETAR